MTMMEAIKKVREREMTHLIWCFGKLVATTHGFPRQCSKYLLRPRARPTPAVDRGIKLGIAVDARALDFGRTYCGNASTHRGR